MIAIKHRFTNTTCCEFDVKTVREAAEKGKANLRGADLRGADLSWANLRGADLCGADLRGADLGEEKGKILANGFFSVGPLGPRKDVLQAFHTDKGIWIKTGCFYGSLETFRNAVTKTHADNNFGFEYIGICNFIEHHFAAQVEALENGK